METSIMNYIELKALALKEIFWACDLELRVDAAVAQIRRHTHRRVVQQELEYGPISKPVAQLL